MPVQNGAFSMDPLGLLKTLYLMMVTPLTTTTFLYMCCVAFDSIVGQLLFAHNLILSQFQPFKFHVTKLVASVKEHIYR